MNPAYLVVLLHRKLATWNVVVTCTLRYSNTACSSLDTIQFSYSDGDVIMTFDLATFGCACGQRSRYDCRRRH